MVDLTINKSSVYHIRDTILILIIVLIVANASILSTDNFLLGIFILSSVTFLLRRYFLDPIVFYVVATWIAINYASYLFNETSFDWYTFMGFTVKIIYPYILLKLIGPQFPFRLEKIIYSLTIISLPIYILEIAFPDLFASLATYLNFITQEEQKQAGGWYIFIFMHSAWSESRNCGFMWEPGAFAFMILLGMSIRFMQYGMIKFDKRITMYIIALLTSFSTMGYFGLFIILTAYIIQQRKLIYLTLLLPLFAPVIMEILQLDFLLPKISTYFNQLDVIYNPENQSYLKVNRFSYTLLAIQQSLAWPFGFGIVPSKYILKEHSTEVLGVSTLANILIYWGWLGILFFFYGISKFYAIIQTTKNNALLYACIISLAFAFFSNPLEKSPILFLILFYPFVFKKFNVAPLKKFKHTINKKAAVIRP